MCFILTEYNELIGLLESVMNFREGIQKVYAAKAGEDRKFRPSIFDFVRISRRENLAQ
jgi:hypothetical protein